MNNWIVPYCWSYFKEDGFLQPFFTVSPKGKAHLEYCNLLDANMIEQGQWHRTAMPLSVVRDLEGRYVKECVRIYTPGTSLLVPVNPLKLER